MKVGIEAFVSLLILILVMSVSISLIASDLTVMDVRDSYYSYINELQESNFADAVVDACIDDAQANGNQLTIDIFEDDNGNRSANIILVYKYKVNPIGVSQTKSMQCYVN